MIEQNEGVAFMNQMELTPIKIKPNLKDIPVNNIKEAFETMQERMGEALHRAEGELIKQAAKELGVELKCAEQFLYRHFDFHIETESADSMIGENKVYLTIIPKPVEEIMHDSHVDKECEKQLLNGRKA